ncbi:efflux RND transporter periplasmic adaptor subunit [Sandarakinorhabdus sp.]|uniref:efflux RND transporter periplasmic adaptor subunit n=1 Tax=Sandarakinorhabdus sp. TaxID=1916663 RepID=UPI00286D807C|nr:efflux RND transporter periplasmic adaptor subunit [Sandarakinorhabdus sp.]
MNVHNALPDTAGARPYKFETRGEGDSPPRRWLRPALIALGMLAALFIAWKIFAPGPPVEAPVNTLPQVTVIVPASSPVVENLSAPGSIAARRDAGVGVQGEGGRVLRVLVEPGQIVSQGQVLAVIDKGVQEQQALQLAASVRQAQADARLAEANLARSEALVSRGFVSRADIDTRTAARDSAIARVGVVRAQLAETRARMDRLDVRAPASGLVLSRSVEAGQVVGGGSGTLFRIAEGGVLEMRAQVAEQDMAQLKPGMSVRVTPVGSQVSYPGKLWLLDPVIDPISRQGIARIQLNYAPGLRVGAFARAEIAAAAVSRPMLPQSAVLADATGNYVLVLGADNKVERRPVVIGTVSDGGVGISRGLNGTEKVVASAGAFLKPGDKIAPVIGPVSGKAG